MAVAGNRRSLQKLHMSFVPELLWWFSRSGLFNIIPELLYGPVVADHAVSRLHGLRVVRADFLVRFRRLFSCCLNGIDDLLGRVVVSHLFVKLNTC